MLERKEEKGDEQEWEDIEIDSLGCVDWASREHLLANKPPLLGRIPVIDNRSAFCHRRLAISRYTTLG